MMSFRFVLAAFVCRAAQVVVDAHSPHDVVEALSFVGDTVIVRSRDELLRSSDGGHSWEWIRTVGGQTTAVMSPGYNQDSTVYLSEGGRFLRSEDGGAHWFDQFELCDRGGGPRDFVAQRPVGRISIAQDSNFQLRRGRVGAPYELMNMPPSTKEECFALGADNEGF